MHPMFQVSIDYCNHSSPNSIWKPMFMCSLCLPSRSYNQCWVEIEEVNGIWKCMLEYRDRNLIVFLYANYSHCILWQAIFGETFTVTGGNFANHIFVKCPSQKKNVFDSQNGIWQVLKTSILNTAPHGGEWRALDFHRDRPMLATVDYCWSEEATYGWWWTYSSKRERVRPISDGIIHFFVVLWPPNGF